MREFALRSRLPDGSTQRDHINSYFRQTHEWPAGWKPIICPESTAYLWEYWISMDTRRTSNGFGPNPVTDAEVESWARRHGVQLNLWENMALDAIEFAYFVSKQK